MTPAHTLCRSCCPPHSRWLLAAGLRFAGLHNRRSDRGEVQAWIIPHSASGAGAWSPALGGCRCSVRQSAHFCALRAVVFCASQRPLTCGCPPHVRVRAGVCLHLSGSAVDYQLAPISGKRYLLRYQIRLLQLATGSSMVGASRVACCH